MASKGAGDGGGWRAEYRRKLVTPQRAVAPIKSGDRIYAATGQHPEALELALAGRAGELENVELMTTLGGGEIDWYGEAFRGRINITIFQPTSRSREAINQGMSDLMPWWVFNGHKGLDEARPGYPKYEVTWINVSRPNKSGWCCTGYSLWDAVSSLSRAKLVLAEVNENIPEIPGHGWVHVSQVDYFVEHTRPLPLQAGVYPPPDPWDKPIADLVSTLVRDGDTIQIGTGSTTGNLARLGAFDDKSDLGYFAELTVPGVVELAKRGVITSKRMETHPGKFICTQLGNSLEDWAYAAQNHFFEMWPVEYVHDPCAIGRNENMVAINNVLGVDLTGQLSAASIGPRVYSGTGGQLAYALGAHLSKGGRYICVLPSTARGGAISRIAPHFEAGQHVSVPRELADVVVTEHGVAYLLNRTVRQRAEALIEVAHPDFRGELRKAARQLFWGERKP